MDATPTAAAGPSGAYPAIRDPSPLPSRGVPLTADGGRGGERPRISAASTASVGASGLARTVEIHPIIVKFGNDDDRPGIHETLNRRIEMMKSVWGKLGVSFTVAPTIEAVLAEAFDREAADDVARVNVNRVWACWDGTGVGVFVVEDPLQWTGGGKTYSFNMNTSKIAITDGGRSDTLLAHELGHALGLQHPPDGADANTVMEPTDNADLSNPTRNTIGNYRRMVWPLPTNLTRIHPDP
jgi:hypothetical protein